ILYIILYYIILYYIILYYIILYYIILYYIILYYIILYYIGRREKTNESQYLQQNGVPAHTAKIIAKINQHKPELRALGILPNQIRTLLKGSLDSSEFMEDVSKTLFWSGYKIW